VLFAQKKCIYFKFISVFFFMVTYKAEELRKALWEKNVPAKVYVGMRYWHPFTEEAIEQVDFSRICFFFSILVFKY
jgi:protoheme ferro-lyase